MLVLVRWYEFNSKIQYNFRLCRNTFVWYTTQLVARSDGRSNACVWRRRLQKIRKLPKKIRSWLRPKKNSQLAAAVWMTLKVGIFRRRWRSNIHYIKHEFMQYRFHIKYWNKGYNINAWSVNGNLTIKYFQPLC